MTKRPHTDAFYQRLWGASRLDLQDAGGADVLQLVTRGKRAHLNKCASPNYADAFGVDMVADMLAFSDKKSTNVLQLLNEVAGQVAITMPADTTLDTGPQAMGHLAKEAGELISKMGEALADDGRISSREVTDLKLIKECTDVLVVVVGLRELLKRRLEGVE